MKVYSPNKEYTGVSASVPFCNGTGETDDPHLIEWFKEHGYTVKEPKVEAEPIKEPETESEEPEEAKASKGKQSKT